jgi:hypothetical protein
MIGDDDLRDCFAMFAMMGLISRGSVWEFKEAWEIADGMLEARNNKEPEVGIVAVKSRRRK